MSGRCRGLFQRLHNYGLQFNSYHVATYAASASFFLITAVFPLLMVVFSIISYTSLSTDDFIDMVAQILPGSFGPILTRISEDLMQSSATTLSVSLIVMIWTAGKSMFGLVDGLNAIVGINDTRNFFLKRIICVGYMLILILAVLANLGLRVFGKRILQLLEPTVPNLAGWFASVLGVHSWTMFLVFVLVFGMIYTVFPSKKLNFFFQLPGAAFTSLAWQLFSSLFSIYVNRIGQFSALYGGLTMMILAMLWLYFCMYIVFVGAVINKYCPELFWRIYVAIRRWFGIHFK